MQQLELKVPPVVVVIVVAALMWASATAFSTPSFGFAYASFVAATVAVVGIGIGILGVLAFRAVGTTVDPRVPEQSRSLVTRGVYGFSRNPMYLGLLLLLLAWGVYLGAVAGLVMLPFFVLYLNRFQIMPEERQMREKFGAAYREYAQAVRRWI